MAPLAYLETSGVRGPESQSTGQGIEPFLCEYEGGQRTLPQLAADDMVTALGVERGNGFAQPSERALLA